MDASRRNRTIERFKWRQVTGLLVLPHREGDKVRVVEEADPIVAA
jgi:hypothetical protein